MTHLVVISIRLIVFLLGAAIIAGIPLLTYSHTGGVFFAAGSDALIDVARAPGLVVACVTAALIGWVGYLCWTANLGAPQVAALLVLVALWALSGRAFAVHQHENLRVSTGWFVFKQQTVALTEPGMDRERYAARSQATPVAWTFVDVGPPGETTRFFVGPFAQPSALSLLEDCGFEVEP